MRLVFGQILFSKGIRSRCGGGTGEAAQKGPRARMRLQDEAYELQDSYSHRPPVHIPRFSSSNSEDIREYPLRIMSFSRNSYWESAPPECRAWIRICKTMGLRLGRWECRPDRFENLYWQFSGADVEALPEFPGFGIPYIITYNNCI